MTDFTTKTCKPCEGGTSPLQAAEIEENIASIDDWAVVDGHLERTFQFENFYETIAFVNVVAWLANQEDHHPDLEVSYRNCTVRYWTHAIDGLSENDFICAAKINNLMNV